MDQESMLASFPTDGKDFAESSEPKKKCFVDYELDHLPWELHLDDSKPVIPLIKQSRTINYSTVHDNHSTQRKLRDTEMTADELSEIFSDLEHKRRSMDALKDHLRDFRWQIMGGRWTRENLGVNSNCYRGYAASAPSKAFCDQICLFKSYDISIKVAGDVAAMQLVN